LQYAVDQIGGFVCSWRNSEPQHGEDGQVNSAYNSVEVHVIPDPDDKFSRYGIAGAPQDRVEARFGARSHTGCVASTGFCGTDVEVSGSWLEIRMIGLDLEQGATDFDARAKATPLIQSMVDRMPEPKASDGAAGTVDCAVALPPVDQTLLQLGVPDGTTAHGYGGPGGYEQSEAAAEYAGSQWCSEGYLEGDGRWVRTEILPGGAWVFRQGEAALSVANGTEPVRIRGTSATTSYLACEVGRESPCTLDMAVGGDWVQVWLSKRNYEAPTAEQDRAELLALAEHVIDNLQ
jgi:hypothetical protein